LIVLAISCLAYLLATLGWMYCLRGMPKLRKFGSYFLIRQIGESLSMINPTGVVGGDAAKAYLNKGNSTTDENASSVLGSRGLLWISYLFVCLIALFLYLSLDDKINWTIVSILLVVLCLSIFLLFKLFFGNRFLSRFIGLSSKLSSSIKLQDLLDKFSKIGEQLRSLWLSYPGNILMAIIFFTLHYICGALEFRYILSSIDIEIGLYSALVLEVGTSMIRSLALFVPGQVGIEEYSNKMFLQLVGVNDEGVWVSVSIIRRARQLFWILFSVGAYFLFYHKRVFKDRSFSLKSMSWKSYS